MWFPAQLQQLVYLMVDHDASTLEQGMEALINPYKQPKLYLGQLHSLQQIEDLFLHFLSGLWEIWHYLQHLGELVESLAVLLSLKQQWYLQNKRKIK